MTLPFTEPRLTPGTELAAVWEVMRDGQWRTLPEIGELLAAQDRNHLSTSISARLRQLRSRGCRVESRVRSGYTWEYRVTFAG